MLPSNPATKKRALKQASNSRASKNLLRAIIFVLLLSSMPRLYAQAALLLEQPYGVFGTLNPTGHTAIYLERVCADTPVHLRMCNDGETGVVISRYHGMGGYDWVAIPLIPYLYAVDDPAKVPTKVDPEIVRRFRDHYREALLGTFGDALPKGNAFRDGWVQLVGTAYDRRTYAFRFATTPEQDRQLVARVNALSNVSHFNLEYNNCADFDRFILNNYFPHQFKRTIFPDVGMTTPKHIAYSLVKYSKRHPETQLTILEIPQVPGNRHESRSIRGVDESLVTDGYVIPIAVLNPYIGGGLLADYLVKGRYNLVPKNPATVGPEHLDALTQPSDPASTPASTPASSETGSQEENPPDSVQPAASVPNEDASAPAHSTRPAQAPSTPASPTKVQP
ncbi:hypothetical protein [Acidicapsa acidisoli]|uniref:hypothetical protein n=1 Tax=Acidicapsa acidisoli TaxID=1615681 RepID=UPI0021DF6366|nr:hypothetical protein [Acidicapsa acidisoli]